MSLSEQACHKIPCCLRRLPPALSVFLRHHVLQTLHKSFSLQHRAISVSNTDSWDHFGSDTKVSSENKPGMHVKKSCIPFSFSFFLGSRSWICSMAAEQLARVPVAFSEKWEFPVPEDITTDKRWCSCRWGWGCVAPLLAPFPLHCWEACESSGKYEEDLFMRQTL